MNRIIITIGLIFIPYLAVSQNEVDSAKNIKISPISKIDLSKSPFFVDSAKKIWIGPGPKRDPSTAPLVFIVLNDKEYLVEKKDNRKIFDLADCFESIEVIICKKDLEQYAVTENGVILIHPKRKHYRAFKRIVKKK